MDDVYLTDVLSWKGDAFRRSDPLHRPILAHVAGHEPGSTREWRYADAVDILGSSSLLDWDSDRSARSDEAGRLSRAINSEGELFTKGEHPQPAVGIMLNEDLFHFAQGSSSSALDQSGSE